MSEEEFDTGVLNLVHHWIMTLDKTNGDQGLDKLRAREIRKVEGACRIAASLPSFVNLSTQEKILATGVMIELAFKGALDHSEAFKEYL